MKKLNAKGKGEYAYDQEHDTFLLKVKDRFYDHSLEFGSLIVDIDTEGFIMGLRIMDAAKMFSLQKEDLINLQDCKFTATVEENTISILLRFTTSGEHPITQGEHFIREATGEVMDSEVLCTIA
ncbi:MAG: DUF2283 domain-containing protein [Candidatus Nanoarchaeia archaeon]